MTGNEIRRKFLKYFEDNGHAVINSSPLVPQDDPTLLFTNAGMVQFKRLFMGEEKRRYTRAVSCQRCVRAGGKHNDLENVGHTARHHTFFEMLGNFSFGDYFKEDAIHFAWNFLTKELGLAREKLWVSVFEEDDEAHALWEKVDGLPSERIVRLGEKDNFWAMGDTGPCGPCSEIHIDQGPEVGCGHPECKVGCERDCDRYLELWNLVFMQFYRDASGKMTPLPKPSIDTGMGLERIAAVIQGKHSNYDSDLFSGLIGKIASLTNCSYGADEQNDTAMRVIADHCRSIAFLVGDGVLPSNEGRGYVLRRIMRRAVRFGRSLGLEKPFLDETTAVVVKQMGEPYPHLLETKKLLSKVTGAEEERFRETLDHGLTILSREIELIRSHGTARISGEFIFKMYDTYGFPIDIVRDIAMEQGLAIDEDGFNTSMTKQRERSKKSWKEGGLGSLTQGVQKLIAEGHAARFTGYTSCRTTSIIAGIIDEKGDPVNSAALGERVSIFCPETPFYAEAGGQVGDKGRITGPNGKGDVRDTLIVGDGIILHETEITKGTLSCGNDVELEVSPDRRQQIACNHTATHILHGALKAVLGDHVKQSGSLVLPDRLRFDFTHFSPITEKEIMEIELIANRKILDDLPVTTEIQNREQAMQSGATALFGEKYDDSVRVVALDSFSRELCGGTHVSQTGEIGSIKIISETGIAAGIRRIEAVSAMQAFRHHQELSRELDLLSNLLKSPAEEMETKLRKILARHKELEKEVSDLMAKLSLTDLDEMIQSAKMVGDVRVVAAAIPLNNPKTMREVGDKVRDRLDSGVAILGGVFQGKVALLVLVTKDLTHRLHAGELIKKIAGQVGGSGGGRPDMAQAGGSMVDKLPSALEAAYDIVAAALD